MVKLVAIDDDREFLRKVSEILRQQEDIEILSGEECGRLELVREPQPRIVVLDLREPGAARTLLDKIQSTDPGVDVVVVARQTREDAADAGTHLAAIAQPLPAGKPFQERDLSALLREAGEHARFEGMIGAGPAMRQVFEKIKRVAPHFRTLTVTGATGTGKELVARALHQLSPAGAGPFVVCNCAAIAETLVESELFGSTRGAFTGAVHDKIGLFEYAHGGTLLLDEVGEMPLGAQAKLLRAVQQQEVQRVGSPVTRKVNVRVIAATHRDLRAMVDTKLFREDLFFRLSMVEISLPPVEQRPEDIPLLLAHFMERFASEYIKPIGGLTGEAQAALQRYSWPGNVREMENVLGYAAMMCRDPFIGLEDLPEIVLRKDRREWKSAALMSLEEMELAHARRVLASVGGDKVRAAEILGVSRATLYRLLARTAG